MRPQALDDTKLIALYSEVFDELMERGIVRSTNNPVADLAERLVADYFGVELEPQSRKGFDLLTGDGRKVPVKAARRSAKGRFALSAFRSDGFDVVAVLLFEKSFRLVEVLLVPREAFLDLRSWSRTWNAHRLGVTQALRADERVISIPPQEFEKQAGSGQG
jgi:hypothetical protein